MLVSWNWLKDYVPLEVTPAELTDRLMMAGLNHESTEAVGSDFAIDLEVTSNRPDCLGHLGVAREAAVLLGQPLKVPAARPKPGATRIDGLAQITLQCPDLCEQYQGRVIRGVKIKPSPAWLADRLRAVGVAVINNVVDVTNFVLLECGQPLHAFDLAKLRGRQIIVRRARKEEPFTAIDHKTYLLDESMCVIADAERPVALAGIMGGADTEVSPATTELLLESAEFAPLAIRTTSRQLGLRSPSSYRFERGVDPEGVEWASRRACELILELAGGELAAGGIAVGKAPPQRPTIILRLAQLKRILGIEIPAAEVRRILTALGCEEKGADGERVSVVPPSWRRDLTREIDLVEEAARVYGYDQIPEDVGVPMAASHRTDADRVLARVRQTLVAAGFDEALTASVVPEKLSSAFSPWTDAAPLVANTPLLKGADRLRRSLVPSLLEARRINESLANPVCELFETARAYLPAEKGLPREQWTLAAASGGDYVRMKGVAEALLAALQVRAPLAVVSAGRHALLEPAQSGRLELAGELLGFVGMVSKAGREQAGLRSPASVLELDLAVLARHATLIPQYAPLSPFPAIRRDLNLIVAEPVRWADLSATVRQAAGELLEALDYLETYRDEKKDGAGRKRLIFSLSLRSPDRTLTSEEADAVRDRVVAACQKQHQAQLLG